MTIIITHPGKAHRDEFVACCLVLAHDRAAGVVVEDIHRREPAREELDDPDTWVIDVGGRYEPELLNFDHHQFDRDQEPQCAASMVFHHFGMADETIFPWLEVTRWIDSKGPFATAKEYDLSADTLFLLQSPVEAQMLQLFQEYAVVPKYLLRIMDIIGDGWVDYFRKRRAREKLLAECGSVFVVGQYSVFVNPAENDFALGVEEYLRERHPTVAVVVSKDDRGPGMSLFRRNDHPSFDFSRLASDARIAFAHNGGFIAKTKAPLSATELKELITKAIKGE